MTDGHKHRMLHVKSFDVLWVRLLRRPLRHETNMLVVDPSPYPYGPCTDAHCANHYLNPRPDCYTLSTLGILHRWTGLTLCNTPRPCPYHDPHCGDMTCDDDHG